jgi:DNA-binding SARP family transcriptional activator
LQIAAGRQRALLAILLLHANRTVSREQIVDALWGENVPDSVHKMVQTHVSQLRKALPEPRLHTRPPGYLLEVGDEELDLARFQRSVAEARQALSQNNPREARELLGHVLALWRGRALAEFSEPFAQHESARLEELHVAAIEWRIEADLSLGHHRDVVGELEALIAEHPLREHPRSQHMLALYRSGRHAEALASYQAFRRTLADELGIEPSASLRELERLMLRQNPTLELPASSRARTFAHVEHRSIVGAEREIEVAHARSGDARIAYQVVGDRPFDLVLVHGWACTFQPGLGESEAGGLLPAACVDGTTDPLRQARHRPLRHSLARAIARPRGADGRRPCRHGRCRVRTRRRARHLGRRTNVGTLRRDTPPADHGARSHGHLRPDEAGAGLRDRGERP